MCDKTKENITPLEQKGYFDNLNALKRLKEKKRCFLGKVYLIQGCMSSGKTTKLLKIKKEQSAYFFECSVETSLIDLVMMLEKSHEHAVVCIDEIQFLHTTVLTTFLLLLRMLVEKSGKQNFYLAGLTYDYKMDNFGITTAVMELETGKLSYKNSSDAPNSFIELETLFGTCVVCGNEADHNVRVPMENEILYLKDKSLYKTTCKTCAQNIRAKQC